MPEEQIPAYLQNKLVSVPIGDFLVGITPEELAADVQSANMDEEA